jgi:hypothetical protein
MAVLAATEFTDATRPSARGFATAVVPTARIAPAQMAREVHEQLGPRREGSEACKTAEHPNEDMPGGIAHGRVTGACSQSSHARRRGAEVDL